MAVYDMARYPNRQRETAQTRYSPGSNPGRATEALMLVRLLARLASISGSIPFEGLPPLMIDRLVIDD